MNGSLKLVTAIVSVHNIETLIPKCLESLKAQTFRNLEILLIDDGSTDGSGRLCDEFAATEPRARVIHQENQGLWAVRNRGVEEAKGEFITFPDGDDYFHKDYIRLLYEAITSSVEKEYQLAICDFEVTSNPDEDIQSDSTPVFEELDKATLLDKMRDPSTCGDALWGANWNKLYRKSALPSPFQRNYLRSQDFDSNLRLFFQMDRAVYVHKVLYYWFQRTGQLTRSVDMEQLRNECRSRIYYDNYVSIPDQVSHFRPSIIVNLYRRLLIWKADSRGTSEEHASSIQIRYYQRKTLFYFLFHAPLPFRRKIRWLLKLNSPAILDLLDKFGRLFVREGKRS